MSNTEQHTKMDSDKPSRDLSSLRIDRSPEVRTGGGRSYRLLILAAVGLMVAAGAWLLVWPRLVSADPSVRVVTATSGASGAASSTLTASGYVVAQRQAAVSSKATGRLVYLGVEEGDRVKAGAVLGRVESDDVEAELARAQANVGVAQGQEATARARLKEARLSFDRTADLQKQQLVSQAEFDAAEAAFAVAEAEVAQATAAVGAAQAAVRAAEVVVENTRIRAPFDGTVLTKTADVGEMVAPFGSAQSARGAVVTLADMESLEVEADVSESNIERVVVGAPAEIVLDAYPAYRYQGRVKKIVPTADRAKATVLTKIEFIDKDERVLPEMSAKVLFLDAASAEGADAQAVTIPASALVTADGSTWVFLLEGDRVVRQPVDAGPVRGGRQFITRGLTPGDRIVDRPPADLRDGDRVTVENNN